MTPHEIKRRFPNASAAFVAANATAGLTGMETPVGDRSARPAAVVERGDEDEPLPAARAYEGNAVRFLVRVTSVRKRLLDEDNISEKALVDCLRYSGIIPSDAPGHCRIETAQKLCRTGETEKTIIRVEVYDC